MGLPVRISQLSYRFLNGHTYNGQAFLSGVRVRVCLGHSLISLLATCRTTKQLVTKHAKQNIVNLGESSKVTVSYRLGVLYLEHHHDPIVVDVHCIEGNNYDVSYPLD